MPYQIKLHNGNLIFAPKDIDECVRIRDDNDTRLSSSPDISKFYNYQEEEEEDDDEYESESNDDEIDKYEDDNNNNIIMDNIESFSDDINELNQENIDALDLLSSIEFIKKQVNSDFFNKMMLDYQKIKDNDCDDDNNNINNTSKNIHITNDQDNNDSNIDQDEDGDNDSKKNEDDIDSEYDDNGENELDFDEMMEYLMNETGDINESIHR